MRLWIDLLFMQKYEIVFTFVVMFIFYYPDFVLRWLFISWSLFHDSIHPGNNDSSVIRFSCTCSSMFSPVLFNMDINCPCSCRKMIVPCWNGYFRFVWRYNKIFTVFFIRGTCSDDTSSRFSFIGLCTSDQVFRAKSPTFIYHKMHKFLILNLEYDSCL